MAPELITDGRESLFTHASRLYVRYVAYLTLRVVSACHSSAADNATPCDSC